jgi:hypothetical protein
VPFTAFGAGHVVDIDVKETVLVDDRDTRIVAGVVVVTGGTVAGPVTVIETIFISVLISAITFVVRIPTEVLISVNPSDRTGDILGRCEFNPDPSVNAVVTPNPVVVCVPTPRIVANPVPTVRVVVRPVTVGVRLPIVLVNVRHEVPCARDINPATLSCQ